MVWNTNMAAVLLFWNSNMATVTGLATVAVKTLDSAILRINHKTADNDSGKLLGVVI